MTTLLSDILEILQFVHQQNVIHRDIKPHNLIRCQDNNKIFLIDFGAVKLLTTQLAYIPENQRTSVSIAIGTPGYMPNEQQGGRPRFSSDIYAVGMIAIQALTGLTATQLQEDQQTGEILWRDHAQVSPQFAAILDKMVRTHFKDRYKSVTEVLHDLGKVQKTWKGKETLQDQEPSVSPTVLTSAMSPIAIQQLSDRTRKGLILGAAVLFSLIGGYGYWRWQSQPPIGQSTSQNIGENAAQSIPIQSLKSVNTLTVHKGAVFAVVISSDGKNFVSGSGDQTIKLWDMQTGELLHTLTGHMKEVATLAISRDGQLLVSGSRDNTLKIWDLKAKKLLRTLRGHQDWLRSVAISPDGKTLASGSKDHTVKLWNLETGELLHTLVGHTNEVESVAIAPDNQTVLSGSEDATIKLWNLRTGKLLRTLSGSDGEIESITLSLNGKTLVSGGEDKTSVWDLESGQVLQSLIERSGIVRSVNISPDGQTLIGSYQDNTIKLWNLGTGTLLRTLAGHSDWVLGTAISPDGQTLISGSRDKTIRGCIPPRHK